MSSPLPSFEQLGLSPSLLKSLKAVGYESPSPIQAESIPPLLEGRDLLGQAQTGTGKTAAFALPILQNINMRVKSPQVLVLAPTRELAIQVAEAFQRYAAHMKGFHVLPIYGGQGYENQIRALKRGVQVVVGTPGRVMDHIRKKTLKLDSLTHLVLDEADEMLRMGFIDDVEWVLSHCPEEKQIALFSATMPKEIAKVANTYLHDPVHIQIKVATTTAETIRQRYWPVASLSKLEALTRILEVETFDAMIIFVRTKTSTVDLSQKLEARGYRCAALNGDISQNVREQTVERLKKGLIDILIATDVAARGLDVERISHVLNLDIPYDTEAYVHRIGRTGRAGRNGEAILFVTKRELRMLRAIEKSTGKKIEQMRIPSVADVNQHRVVRFKQNILDTIENGDISPYQKLISEMQQESQIDLLDIAASIALMAEGEQPLVLEDSRPPKRERSERKPAPSQSKRAKDTSTSESDIDMETFRIEVGHDDQVSPQNIVGAIANEADIDSQYIGHIKIMDDHSLVELPAGMPKQVFKTLKKTWVCQKQLNITKVKTGTTETRNENTRKRPPSGKKKAKDSPRTRKKKR